MLDFACEMYFTSLYYIFLSLLQNSYILCSEGWRLASHSIKFEYLRLITSKQIVTQKT